MSIASALVLFLVIWCVVFFIALPMRIQTQGEAGDVVPGTHSSSPQNHHLKKKAWIVTAITSVIWVIVAGIIITGVITVEDIDMFGRMSGS